MNKKYTYALFAGMLSLGFASCSNEEEVTKADVVGQQFEATFEGFDDNKGLKTSLVVAGGKYVDSWTPGDAIMVSDGNVLSKFTTTSEGSVRAKFLRGSDQTKLSEAAGTTYLSYYPAEGCVSSAGDSAFNVVLPAVYKYNSKGLIDNGSYPMIGISDNFKMPFYNLCGLLRVKVVCQTPSIIKKIDVKSSRHNLTGEGVAKFEGGKPKLVMEDSNLEGSTLIIDCGDGINVDENGVYFFVVLPPNSYKQNELTFNVTTSTGNKAYISPGAFDIDRSELAVITHNLPIYLGDGADSKPETEVE